MEKPLVFQTLTADELLMTTLGEPEDVTRFPDPVTPPELGATTRTS